MVDTSERWKFMIEGNDGGIGITHDRGKNWVFDDKLPVGNFIISMLTMKCLIM
jgi:hypothetical protein